METIRSVPVHEPGEMIMLRTTTVHGRQYSSSQPAGAVNKEHCLLRLNGTKVLLEDEYYATCILRTKKIFRLEAERAR